MKYFGTDGIRGIVCESLNEKIIKKMAKALVKFYEINKINKVLLVGNDSRISSDYILSNICSVLLKYGIEVHNLGVCSSPCLAYISREFNYPLAMMISASHNPSEYNGIKFFNCLGEKIDEQTEQALENLMDKPLRLKKTSFALLKNVEELKNKYVNFLKSLIKFKTPCIFDCAFGGVSEICKLTFPKSKKINCRPNGQNINSNAGCTHIEMLKQFCIQERKIGFAFDGDADRVLAVSETGNIIDGDKILYILSKFYLTSGDTLIGTIYSNSGLETSLKKRNIKFYRADVGDKKVYSAMLKYGSALGGENSGHIIIKQYTNTGDGLLTAIILMNILSISHLKFDDLLNDYKEHFQLMKNIKLEGEFVCSKELKEAINALSTDETRIILRLSGTESVLRLMAESKSLQKCSNAIETITKYLI